MFKHKNKGKNTTREPQINLDNVSTETTPSEVTENTNIEQSVIPEVTPAISEETSSETIGVATKEEIPSVPEVSSEATSAIDESIAEGIEEVHDIGVLEILNEETMMETPAVATPDTNKEETAEPSETDIAVQESATIYSSIDDVDPDILLDLNSGEVTSRKDEKKTNLQEIIPNPVEPIKMNLKATEESTKTPKVSVKKTFWHVLIALLIIVAIVGFIIYSKSGIKNTFDSPLSINNHAVASDEFSFMYHYILIENGVDVFASDAQEMLNSPSEDPNYSTNRDYFLDITAKELQTTQLLYDDATKNGYRIEEKHYSKARAYIDWLNTKSSELNVSLDTYIKGIFGSQVDEQCVIDTLAKKYFTEDYASDAKLVELQATSEQAAEAYEANRNAYDLVSYKLLRITYEQREDAFISTANLHANQIIEAMGNDQSMFELVASEYFSGDAKEQLLEPDATLIKDARYADITHEEFRNWLFDTERMPGDTVIFPDEDGFPIILCFVSRTKQLTPLRNVKIIEVTTREADENGENAFSLGDAQSLSQSIYDYCTDETKLQSVENYFTDEVLDGTIYITASVDTYPGKFSDNLNSWIFNDARKPGDKQIIESDNGFYVVYFISESTKPEWYDRVNSFIRMNNYQAFLNEVTTDYSYKFNQSGLEQIQDVP